MNKKRREIFSVNVPKGYELEDFLDYEDDGYLMGEPILVEEVIINFERDNERNYEE